MAPSGPASLGLMAPMGKLTSANSRFALCGGGWNPRVGDGAAHTWCSSAPCSPPGTPPFCAWSLQQHRNRSTQGKPASARLGAGVAAGEGLGGSWGWVV